MGMAAAAQGVHGPAVCAVSRCPAARRSRLVGGLQTIGGVELNASDPVIEETVSIRIDGIRADALADALDIRGIYVSAGSACHAGEDTVSHVLTAQGLTEEQARSRCDSPSVRICLWRTSTVSWSRRLGQSIAYGGLPGDRPCGETLP